MSIFVDIKKSFKGFSLDVKFASEGAPLGILGASGSGKSITLKCIAGIETPDKGQIVVNGRVLFDSEKKINLRPQKRRIGYLFQSYALFPNMTLEQNIACALSCPKAEKEQQIAQLVQSFELSGLEKRYPCQLSGGQQQRAALARILAYKPDVLLLDEPFSALDAHLKEALQMDMKKLLESYSGDAVMVTHNRDEVYRICQNLMVLDDGRVCGFGGVREMFKKPATLAAARLTGCKNIAPAKRIADDTVFVPDWNRTLKVVPPVSPRLTHVGIRAHYFYPCENEAAVNAIKTEIYEQVESPFEWNVLFKNADTKGAGGSIWWKYTKEAAPAQMPKYLCVSPENVLLLEED